MMVNTNRLHSKKITVIGGGVSGISLAFLARNAGAQVFLSETKPELDDHVLEKLKYRGIDFEAGGHSERTWETDLVLLSSGISPDSEAVRNAEYRKLEIQGELDFIYPWLTGKLIGITGSNGKTTTTSLTAHLIEKCGYSAGKAGNIGVPLAESIGMGWDYTVMELSSFQLYWTSMFSVDLAVITNLAPDHIDWHGSYANYKASKKKLVNNVRGNGWAILQEKDYRNLNLSEDKRIALLSWEKSDERVDFTRTRIIVNEKEIKFKKTGLPPVSLAHCTDIPLIGRHNIENTAMAMAVLELLEIRADIHPSEMLEDFSAPPHRCQFIKEIDGVRYIDDSKGTNVAATMTALSSIEGPKVIILGGKGKGEDYTPLAETVAQYALSAILIGEEKEAIERSLVDVNFNNFKKVDTMEEALSAANHCSKKGTTVILSPACTSWDMYESYIKRGEHFQKLVNDLAKEKKEY